jgi:prolyl-tRNA synthetase
LLGIPHCVVVGDRGIGAGKLEYRHRRSGTTEEIAVDGIVAELSKRLAR